MRLINIYVYGKVKDSNLQNHLIVKMYYNKLVVYIKYVFLGSEEKLSRFPSYIMHFIDLLY